MPVMIPDGRTIGDHWEIFCRQSSIAYCPSSIVSYLLAGGQSAVGSGVG